MIDDLIYEAMEFAFNNKKPNNKKMNKVKVYTFTGTAAELKEQLAKLEKAEKENTLLKERLAEREKAEKEKEKTPMRLYREFEKKWNEMTEEYEKDMEILNEKIEKLLRPFNEDMCDSESDIERGK